MIVILDKHTEKRVADPAFDLVKDPVLTESLDGVFTFRFEYPMDEPDAIHLAEGNRVLVQDQDNNWQEFEIMTTDEVVNQSGKYIRVYCEHAYYELQDDPRVDLNFTSDSATFALTQILSGTRWQVGTVQINTSRTRAMTNLNPLAAIRDVESIWGGELRFRVTISGAGIAGRYVDLVQRRGAFRGHRFEIGHDMQGVTITTDKTPLKTAMYGWGMGEALTEDGETERLDFADVEWAKGQPAELHPGGETSPAPANKPLGQKWVGDEDARLNYGRGPDKRHIFGEYESQAKSPQALLWETWRQLEKVKEPLINVEAPVATLEQFEGFEHEKSRLGDTSYVVVDDYKEPLTARVLRVSWNITDSSKTVVELGNFRPVMSATLAEMQRRQRDAAARQGIWDRADSFNPDGSLNTTWLDGVVDVLKHQLLSTASNWHTDNNGNLVFEAADGNSAMMLTGAGFMVASSKDAQGAWNWRTFGTGSGFTADEINAGKLRTSLVQIIGDTHFYWDGNTLYAVDPQNPNRQWRYNKDGLRFTPDGGATDTHRLGQDKVYFGTDAEFAGKILVGASIAGTPATEIETITGAQTKANAAREAAEAVAKAEAELARIQAEAHAADIVSAEEQARIQQAQANLATAKAHAETKAAEAQAAAQSYTDSVAVKRDTPYYGVTIGQANGLRIQRTDGESRVTFNSDTLAFQVKDGADWANNLHFDSVAKKYVFNGLLEAVTGTFQQLTTGVGASRIETGSGQWATVMGVTPQPGWPEHLRIIGFIRGFDDANVQRWLLAEDGLQFTFGTALRAMIRNMSDATGTSIEFGAWAPGSAVAQIAFTLDEHSVMSLTRGGVDISGANLQGMSGQWAFSAMPRTSTGLSGQTLRLRNRGSASQVPSGTTDQDRHELVWELRTGGNRTMYFRTDTAGRRVTLDADGGFVTAGDMSFGGNLSLGGHIIQTVPARVFRVIGSSVFTFVDDRTGAEILGIRTNLGANNLPALRSAVTFDRTTSSSANLHIEPTFFNIMRSVSAKKYKKEIEPLALVYAENFLDKCVPIWYRSACEGDNPGYSWYGYGADDVAEIEPRMVQFRDGQPEGFNYDRVAALLHVIIKDNRRRIEALEKLVKGVNVNGSS